MATWLIFETVKKFFYLQKIFKIFDENKKMNVAVY